MLDLHTNQMAVLAALMSRDGLSDDRARPARVAQTAGRAALMCRDGLSDDRARPAHEADGAYPVAAGRRRVGAVPVRHTRDRRQPVAQPPGDRRREHQRPRRLQPADLRPRLRRAGRSPPPPLVFRVIVAVQFVARN